MRWFFTRGKTRAIQMAELSFVRLSSMCKQLRKDLKELKRVEKNAKSLLHRLELIGETTADDLEDCEKRLVYAEKALEALRSEHEIAISVEIPRLMTALGRFQASDEADIAISNHRRAGATPSPLNRELQ